MRLKLYGVRGSLPSGITAPIVESKIENALGLFFQLGYSKPSDIKHFLNDLSFHQKGTYGANTMCIQVQSQKGGTVIFDSGSGIRTYGMDSFKTEKEFHIFQTHFHWDHTCGLPFFIPIYMPGKTLHFYSPHNHFEQGIRDLFRAPYFPVPYEMLPSTHHFHNVQKYDPVQLFGMEITPFQLDHPNEAFGYHIQEGTKRVVICFDAEFKRMSQQDLGPDLQFYQNADLILFDGQYTISEVLNKIDWGHCTAQVGVDLCLREKIKQMVVVHHDPESTDVRLDELAYTVGQYYKQQFKALQEENPDQPPLNVRWGYEGMIIDL